MVGGEPIIQVEHVRNQLGESWVHDDLSFEVYRGEIIAIIGASGCGKTTLLNTILMLRQQTAGRVRVFDVDTVDSTNRQKMSIRQRWGVMFQGGALFSSLNILENIMFPMMTSGHVSRRMRADLALLKLQLAGLELETAYKFPSELSGGMRKRAALARAIALDPELLFLDEPTAGLDPKSAGELDDLVLQMQAQLGITFIMVTHDLDTLWRVPSRVMFIGEGKVLAFMPMKELVEQTHPLIKSYFSGPRHRQ